MSQNTVDSLLALSSGSNDNTIELSETGQGEIPRKKDQAREFQKRIEAIDRDAKVKIAKLKRLLPHGADGEDAISILNTLNVNDRHEDKKLEKLDILIDKMWEEEDIEEIATTSYKLQDIFITIFFIKTPETQHYFDNYFDNTHSEKTHIGKDDNKLDNAPETCKFKDCEFIVFTTNLKQSKIKINE